MLLNLGLKLDDVRDEVLELLGADMPTESASAPETKKSGVWCGADSSRGTSLGRPPRKK